MDKQFQEFEDRYGAVRARVAPHIDKLSNMIFPKDEAKEISRLDFKVSAEAFEESQDGVRDHWDVMKDKVAALSEEERALLAKVKALSIHNNRMATRRVKYIGKLIDIYRRELGRCIERKGMKITLGELKQFISPERRHLFIFASNLIHDITVLMDWTAFYDIHAPRTDDMEITFYNKPRREA